MSVGVVSTNAANSFGLVGVELGSFAKEVYLGDDVSNGTVTKNVDYLEQSYENIGTVATYGGDYVQLKVRTKEVNEGLYSSYLTLNTNETKTWQASTLNYNYVKGTYTLRLKTAKSLVWGATTSGMWYYDMTP